jgi:hypothetical protein
MVRAKFRAIIRFSFRLRTRCARIRVNFRAGVTVRIRVVARTPLRFRNIVKFKVVVRSSGRFRGRASFGVRYRVRVSHFVRAMVRLVFGLVLGLEL